MNGEKAMLKLDSVRKLFCGAAVCAVIAFLLFAPSQSSAQMYTPSSTRCDCDMVSQTAQKNGSTIAVTKAMSNRLYPMGYGPMQTKLAMCISQIEAAYTALSQMFSGPFDPLALVTSILNMIVTSIILQFLTALCTVMQHDIQSFAKSALNFITNLICIPLPKWNLSIFSINAPPGGHCSGNPFNGMGSLGGLGVTVPPVQPYKFGQ